MQLVVDHEGEHQPKDRENRRQRQDGDGADSAQGLHHVTRTHIDMLYLIHFTNFVNPPNRLHYQATVAAGHWLCLLMALQRPIFPQVPLDREHTAEYVLNHGRERLPEPPG
jgi:hypothetical protein